MVSIKSKKEIELMKQAGRINHECHLYLKSKIKPGITTAELNKLADDFIRSKKGLPSFLHYNGYPASICVSVNDEVVHGIPGNRKLQKGDIVSLDIGVLYKGYHSDSAWTHPVGEISEETKELLKATEEGLFAGIKKVKAGVKLGTVSHAIEEVAKKYNLGVIRELVGHGVGKNLHEDPDVPNFGKEDTGLILEEGMTIAIEPMFNIGSRKVWLCEDDWTIITQSGKPSAHFEHTVLVTKDGYEILTGE